MILSVNIPEFSRLLDLASIMILFPSLLYLAEEALERHWSLCPEADWYVKDATDRRRWCDELAKNEWKVDEPSDRSFHIYFLDILETC